MDNIYHMSFPSAPPEENLFNPHERLTRGEFVAEAAALWDEQINAIERNLERGGHGHNQKLILEGRKFEMLFARKVLMNTYWAEELHNIAGVLGDDTRTDDEAAARIQRGKR